MAQKGIILIENPRDEDFEEYIAAHFQAGGLFVEKNIIYRGKAELLELDLIVTDFQPNTVERFLVEIKSGKWGFSEIFKVKGWMSYLNIEMGVFIIKEIPDMLEYYQDKAKELGINLIDNSNLNNTPKNLQNYLVNNVQESDIETIRFAFLMERKLSKRIKILKRRYPEYQCYKRLDEYLFEINSASFFTNNAIERIGKLFNAYISNKNITAKISHEINTGEYDDDVISLSTGGFNSCFYTCDVSILQVSLYVEHLARITILQSCIQHLISDSPSEAELTNVGYEVKIEYMDLPATITSGLKEIVKEPYFHRYPVFWQFFTYVLGGFILTDFMSHENAFLSERTGIPIEEIPNAFDSYNKLFPKEEGWMHTLPSSNILMHRFFSPALCGLGANYRRMLYRKEDRNDISYDELGQMLGGRHTMKDITKWVRLAYEILK